MQASLITAPADHNLLDFLPPPSQGFGTCPSKGKATKSIDWPKEK